LSGEIAATILAHLVPLGLGTKSSDIGHKPVLIHSILKNYVDRNDERARHGAWTGDAINRPAA
jgi:hypothetical protein